jgi:hypothetical protein
MGIRVRKEREDRSETSRRGEKLRHHRRRLRFSGHQATRSDQSDFAFVGLMWFRGVVKYPNMRERFMRIVGLNLIFLAGMLGTGGCAPSEREAAGIAAKEKANAGYASVENAERIQAQGQASRDPERVQREYRQEVMDRHGEKSKKSQWDSAKKETDAERWWRELWEGP